MRLRTMVLFVSIVPLAGLLGPGVGSAQVRARHCVVWISPESPSGPSKISPMRCFSGSAHAARYARGPAPAAFVGTSASAATTSTTISIDYDSSGYTGSTLTWTVSNTAGCNGSSYSAASMPSGWNDRVSSSHSYAGCAHNAHYHDTNFLGAGINCTGSTMGTMNNQTSSERWTS
jgi:hypothetical protein